MSWDHEEMVFVSGFPGALASGNVSIAAAEILDLNILFSATQIHMVKERCCSSQINVFHQYFPTRIDVLFLSSQFDIVHIHK